MANMKEIWNIARVNGKYSLTEKKELGELIAK